MSISDFLQPTEKEIPLWLNVPPEFQEIDLDEPADSRIDRIARETQKLPGCNPSWQAHAVLSQESLVSSLRQTGAIYAANFVASSELVPTRLVSALFTVVVREPYGLADQSLTEIARGLQENGSHSETLLVDYPAGPAIAQGEHHLVRWNGQSLQIRQSTIIFQFPGRRRLAMIGISSSDLDDWDDFVGVLDGIARTVSFTRPSTGSSSVVNVLDGGPQ